MTPPHQLLRYGFPRTHLIPFLQANHSSTGLCAEIGVREGRFSQLFEMHWRGNIYLIDPYIYYPDDEYPETDKYSQSENDELYFNLIRAHAHNPKVNVLRMTSLDAAPHFPDGSFDFVYIDANHTEKHVSADIAVWWPKIRLGGILCGHDYIPNNSWCSVQSVVNDFSASQKLPLCITCEPDFPSWVIQKPDNYDAT